MGSNLAQAKLAVLLAEATRLEAAQVGIFTTALSDPEARYLDITAELYRRGELLDLGFIPTIKPKVA